MKIKSTINILITKVSQFLENISPPTIVFSILTAPCNKKVELRVSPPAAAATCEVYLKEVVSSIYNGAAESLNKQMNDEMMIYFDGYENPHHTSTTIYSKEWYSLIYPTDTGGSGGVFYTEEGISGKKGSVKVKEEYQNELEIPSTNYWDLFLMAEDFVDNYFVDVVDEVQDEIEDQVDDRHYIYEDGNHNQVCNYDSVHSLTCSQLFNKISKIDFNTVVQAGLDDAATKIKGSFPLLDEIEIELKTLDISKDPAWLSTKLWRTNPGSEIKDNHHLCEWYECLTCGRSCYGGNEYDFKPNKQCVECNSYCEYDYSGYYTAEVRLTSLEDPVTGEKILFRFNVEGYYFDDDIDNNDDMTTDNCNEKSCNQKCCHKNTYRDPYTCGCSTCCGLFGCWSCGCSTCYNWKTQCSHPGGGYSLYTSGSCISKSTPCLP